MKVQPEDLYALVKDLDPELTADDPLFGTAALLLALLLTDKWGATELAKTTGYPIEFVTSRLVRLRNAGVIARVRRRTLDVDWDNEETGMVSFWMDCYVAEGWLQRVR